MNNLRVSGILITITLAFLAAAPFISDAADDAQAKNAPSPVKTVTAAPVQSAADTKTTAAKPSYKSNFVMTSGPITRIDTADPSNIKIEVKDERDGQVHILGVTPMTNITKATDVSELKVGENVRAMARKVDDKEVAMGIMFGKLRKLPAPRTVAPAAQAPATTGAQAAKATAKK